MTDKEVAEQDAIKKNLREMRELGLNKDKIEALKKYQEYKAGSLPFTKTPTFITILISTASILLSGTLGYVQYLTKEKDNFKAERKKLDAEKKKNDEELQKGKEDIAKEKSTLLLATTVKLTEEINSARYLVEGAEKKLDSTMRKSQKLASEKSGLINDKRKLQRDSTMLTAEISTKTKEISTKTKDFDDKRKVIQDSVKALAEIETRTNQGKNQLEILKLFYTLKSDIVTMIAPEKSTLSGFMITRSDIPIAIRRAKLESTTRAIESNPSFKKILRKYLLITLKYNALHSLIQEFKKTSSNRLLHNTRVYNNTMNPLIEEIIVDINDVNLSEFDGA